MTGLGLMELRLALAVVFFAHGAHTMFGLWPSPGIGAGGVQASAAEYRQLGLHPELLIAIIVAGVQVAGGVLLAFGFLTRWASVALFACVGLGVWTVQRHAGFFLNWTGAPAAGHGVEYSVALIGGLLCLVLAGGGEWSIDGLRARSKATQAAGRARLRGKV